MAGYNSNQKQRVTQQLRVWNGRAVKPTRYYGSAHKGTMCGSIDGELVRDVQGNVLPWSSIPYGTVE